MSRFFILLFLCVSCNLFGMSDRACFNEQKLTPQSFDFVKMHIENEKFDFDGLYKFVQYNIVSARRAHLNNIVALSFAINSYVYLNALSCIKDEGMFNRYLQVLKYQAMTAESIMDLMQDQIKQTFVKIELPILEKIGDLQMDYESDVSEIIDNFEDQILHSLNMIRTNLGHAEAESAFKKTMPTAYKLFYDMKDARFSVKGLRAKEAAEKENAEQAPAPVQNMEEITSSPVKKVRFNLDC